MHRFHWRPDEIYNLPPETKRFIYESIVFQLEEEQDAHEKHMKEIARMNR
jgi:hypothetical protein